MPLCFSLNQVRAVAVQFGYTEVDWNETSRVISFCKESVRINVYYTTGTAGTCLHHPVRGKTQLFRRHVSVDQLEQIFRNPRSHTGKGYYYTRQSPSQQWKGADGSLTSDMARRWLYVCSAAEHSVSATHLDVLKRLMNKMTEILWEPGDPPALATTRYACGSRCAVKDIAVEVAIRDGATGSMRWRDGRERDV